MRKSKGDLPENRKHSRFKSFNILQIIRRNDEPVEESPKLVDMSEGGLCFYSSDFSKTGDRIRINIGIPEFNSSVSAFARVVWTQASTEHAGAQFTGVEFIGMKETDRDIIRRLEKRAAFKNG